MTKVTIDNKYKRDIDNIKEFVHANDNVVDFTIGLLGDRMGLKTDEEHEILWDHIMNGSDWCVEYKDIVKPAKRKKR
jgi:hypothetical protein